MKFLLNKPLEQIVFEVWDKVDKSYKKASLFVVGICLLAYGFEMTNLTLHHDDVNQIFMWDLGHGMGRFGFSWEHDYTQNGYFMPFLQMVEAIILMTAYGLLISRFWGVRNTMDIVLVSSIVCVFPYMGQVYQYNPSMVASSLAHFLAAIAVIISSKASLLRIVISATLYMAAFSIYQSVIANAATIFVIWMLSNLLFAEKSTPFFSKSTLRSVISAAVSVCAGGVIYLVAVFSMGMKFESYQATGLAFSLDEGLNLGYAIEKIINGSRSFFFWPEHYFPNYLKKIQLTFLFFAAIACLWLPKKPAYKIGAIVILGIALFMPRILQMLHPEGHFHNLAVTAYAVLIAGCVMVVKRVEIILIRNFSTILAFFLVVGYILQCNWISTVNQLNTMAHYTTLAQVLARVRSLPNREWDGKSIVVVGRYDMSSTYPYKNATGVATEFMDAGHMQSLARLMRDDAKFTNADQTTPTILEFASKNLPWPHPSSVGVVDGVGVVVLSSTLSQTEN